MIESNNCPHCGAPRIKMSGKIVSLRPQFQCGSHGGVADVLRDEHIQSITCMQDQIRLLKLRVKALEHQRHLARLMLDGDLPNPIQINEN